MGRSAPSIRGGRGTHVIKILCSRRQAINRDNVVHRNGCTRRALAKATLRGSITDAAVCGHIASPHNGHRRWRPQLQVRCTDETNGPDIRGLKSDKKQSREDRQILNSFMHIVPVRSHCLPRISVFDVMPLLVWTLSSLATMSAAPSK